MLFDRAHQLAIGEILDVLVDRQRQVVTRLRRDIELDIGRLDRVMVQVLDYALAAGLAGKIVVECKLESFQAVIVDIGLAEDVRGHLA